LGHVHDEASLSRVEENHRETNWTTNPDDRNSQKDWAVSAVHDPSAVPSLSFKERTLFEHRSRFGADHFDVKPGEYGDA
jgi:hypothetical protein